MSRGLKPRDVGVGAWWYAVAGATWSLTSGGRVHSGGARPRGVMGMRLFEGEDGAWDVRSEVEGPPNARLFSEAATLAVRFIPSER